MAAYVAGRPTADALSGDLQRMYVQLGNRCYTLTKSTGFGHFIIVTIVVAIVLVGLQTYPSLANNSTIVALDKVVLGIFAAECVLKIVAESTAPLSYITGPRGGWTRPTQTKAPAATTPTSPI